MKHNSALKQLMREFNTQLALKDNELEASVKEAVGKATTRFRRFYFYLSE